MNPCEKCPIDDKIFECCGRFPESGETSPFVTSDKRSIFSCPNLMANGKCGIYEKRPYACQSHQCYNFDTINGVGEGFLAMRDLRRRWRDCDDEGI
jgi:Fe-S-cluster containining protein